MTKTILVTQRRIIDSKTDEVRDSLDRNWLKFFEKCDLLPILLPSNLALTKKIISKTKFDGVLLTGGGNIISCGGDDLEREEIESFLLSFVIRKKLPLIGVCRGMQKIQDSFGIKIKKLSGHVSLKKKVLINNEVRYVNSFHDFGTDENNDREFEVFARSEDGVVKGFRHRKHKIFGIMWHPERFSKFSKDDIVFFKEVFR
jgi:gamma-glutamyl-gamma-aminobutyrate hydrolase PuuD